MMKNLFDFFVCVWCMWWWYFWLLNVSIFFFVLYQKNNYIGQIDLIIFFLIYQINKLINWSIDRSIDKQSITSSSSSSFDDRFNSNNFIIELKRCQNISLLLLMFVCLSLISSIFIRPCLFDWLIMNEWTSSTTALWIKLNKCKVIRFLFWVSNLIWLIIYDPPPKKKQIN